jgi:hypothetical protein
MAEFVIFDKNTGSVNKYNGEDWYMTIEANIAAQNPGKVPVSVTEHEGRARYVVYYNTPALDKALAKAKTPEGVQEALNENGSVAGRVYLDTPTVH